MRETPVLASFGKEREICGLVDLTSAIANGADVSVVKHIYKTRKTAPSTFVMILTQRVSDATRSREHYSLETPLSDILQDLRVEYYTRKEPKDAMFLASLDKIIREHTQVNPFDKLETGQREAFDNVRQKLAANYDSIQPDMSRIGDELFAKNVAVEKYLRDSTFNLYLSIFALFLTFVFSAYQIYQARDARLVSALRAVFQPSTERP